MLRCLFCDDLVKIPDKDGEENTCYCSGLTVRRLEKEAEVDSDDLFQIEFLE